MEQHKSQKKNINKNFIDPFKKFKKSKIQASLKVKLKSFSGKHIPSYYKTFKVVFQIGIMQNLITRIYQSGGLCLFQ